MSEQRKSDSQSVYRTYFRTERVVKDGSLWYFLTREGKVEGPFETRQEAVDRAQVYARLKEMRLLTEGPERELELL